jgi:hypothetical protein
MKMKIVGILVMTLLIATAYISVGVEENTFNSLKNSVEAEDQKNVGSAFFMEMYEDKFYAQGFTPSQTPLVKVSLEIGKYGNPPDNAYLNFSIRDSLNGDDIVSSQFFLDDLIENIIVFSFPDIDVTIGDKYYIICSVDQGYLETDCYCWRYTFGDIYVRGDAWYSANGISWYPAEEYTIEEMPGVDFGFTTYFRDYAPDDPEIDGQTEGKEQERYDYTFSTIDPEGHDVEYYIEWGDDTAFKWIGPYESDDPVTKSHMWTYEGNYTIRVKARDIYGAESEWSTLEVSMPKNKAKTIDTLLLRFFENYPIIYQILQRFLKL